MFEPINLDGSKASWQHATSERENRQVCGASKPCEAQRRYSMSEKLIRDRKKPRHKASGLVL